MKHTFYSPAHFFLLHVMIGTFNKKHCLWRSSESVHLIAWSHTPAVFMIYHSAFMPTARPDRLCRFVQVYGKPFKLWSPLSGSFFTGSVMKSSSATFEILKRVSRPSGCCTLSSSVACLSGTVMKIPVSVSGSDAQLSPISLSVCPHSTASDSPLLSRIWEHLSFSGMTGFGLMNTSLILILRLCLGEWSSVWMLCARMSLQLLDRFIFSLGSNRCATAPISLMIVL